MMIVCKAHYDGKVIVPDEPLSLAPNQKLNITIEPTDANPPPADRVPGRLRDALIDISPDFNEPLPDDFWTQR